MLMSDGQLLLHWRPLACDPPDLGHMAAAWRGWFLWASPNSHPTPTSWNWGAKPPSPDRPFSGDAATAIAAMVAAEAALLARLSGHERAALARSVVP